MSFESRKSASVTLWIPVFFGLVHPVLSGNDGNCSLKAIHVTSRHPPEKTGMTQVVLVSGFGHVLYMLTRVVLVSGLLTRVVIALCLDMFPDILTLKVLLLSFAYWAMRRWCCKNFGAYSIWPEQSPRTSFRFFRTGMAKGRMLHIDFGLTHATEVVRYPVRKRPESITQV